MSTADIVGLCIVSFLGGAVFMMALFSIMEAVIEGRYGGKSE